MQTAKSLMQDHATREQAEKYLQVLGNAIETEAINEVLTQLRTMASPTLEIKVD